MNKLIVGAVILALVGGVFVSSFRTVDAGHRGVVVRLGSVQPEILPEGYAFVRPFIDRIVELEVRIQKVQGVADCASKDMQQVRLDIAANLNPDPTKVGVLFQEVGPEYMNRIVVPAIQESAKSVTARFTAEELITRRSEVRDQVKTVLASKLESRGILLDDINIVNFDFSESFKVAIEAKVTAEQNALAAKNRLAQIEFEARQEVARAQGKAEAISIESQALKDSPQILQLRALERWDGVLPKVTGGAIPFIQVDEK